MPAGIAACRLGSHERLPPGYQPRGALVVGDKARRIAWMPTCAGMTFECGPRSRGELPLQIDYAVLGAFTLLWLAIVPTPGPNTLLIVHLALTAGWPDVALAVDGKLLATDIYALA